MCTSGTAPHITGGTQDRARGSVLVPVVAAMLILLLIGIALSELFGAQRMQSVLTVESTRAFGIAEAGLWHAAYEGGEITTAVPFAGGSYTVTESGFVFTATGTLGEATRVVSQTFDVDGPLDETASEATATSMGANDSFFIDLINETASPLIIDWFSLAVSPSSTNKINQSWLDGNKVWEGSTSLPTGTVDITSHLQGERTIPAGGQLQDQIVFEGAFSSGDRTFTLIIGFNGGTKSKLVFTLTM